MYRPSLTTKDLNNYFYGLTYGFKNGENHGNMDGHARNDVFDKDELACLKQTNLAFQRGNFWRIESIRGASKSLLGVLWKRGALRLRGKDMKNFLIFFSHLRLAFSKENQAFPSFFFFRSITKAFIKKQRNYKKKGQEEKTKRYKRDVPLTTRQLHSNAFPRGEPLNSLLGQSIFQRVVLSY